MSSAPALSVIIPFKEEGEAAAGLVREVLAVFDGLGTPAEVVLVDDGSRDSTFAHLKAAAEADPRAVAVRLRRNFGQTAALAAGLAHARGELVAFMDGDGQNDPKDLPVLLARLGPDCDVVSGWRKDRQDALLQRKLPSRIANALIARVSGLALHDLGCSLKLYRRALLEEIHLYGEMHRLLPVQAHWVGGRIVEVGVSHRPRTTGVSKYGLDRTFKVLLDLGVLFFLHRYGTKPIYVFGGVGLVSLFLGFLAGCLALFFKLAPPPYHKTFVETPLPLLVVMFGLVGTLAILMGFLAEMLVRIYHETQRKPVFSVAEVVGPPRS